jgi:hypothetical protein
MRCHYDRDKDDYLTDDGEPCRRDDYGDKTKHCTARRTCSVHIAASELTCPRCIGRVRQGVRQVVAMSALMLPLALDEGVKSEAADLAGPAADPRGVRDLRFYIDGHATHAYRTGRIDGAHYERILAALPDDDEWHPYSVLTRWQMLLAEDYDHELPPRLTITGAGEYLERHLNRIAQDPEQDFPLLAREIRRLRTRLESVMHNSNRPERGEPCPICRDEGKVVRLVREYGHWCEDEECTKFHYADDSGDMWRCPVNRSEHAWKQEHYENYVKERRLG